MDRWLNGLQSFGGGDRPAGLNKGADLGVKVVALERTIESRGVTLRSREVRAERAVLLGLGEPLEVISSSSSKIRLRLIDKVEVDEGAMFSAFASTKIGLLVE